MSSKPSKPYDFDPVFLHARREAIVIFCFWLVGLAWCVPYCYFNGYGLQITDAESFSTIFGVPTWLFWGIAVPWLVADLLTTWFCFFFMQDADLGHADDEVEHGRPQEEAK